MRLHKKLCKLCIVRVHTKQCSLKMNEVMQQRNFYAKKINSERVCERTASSEMKGIFIDNQRNCREHAYANCNIFIIIKSV